MIIVIYYKVKEKISMEDILALTIEKLLLFKPKKIDTKNNNGNDNNIFDKKNYNNISDDKNVNLKKKRKIRKKKDYVSINEEQFNEIKSNKDFSSLDNFFARPVIYLFNDIYNQKRNKIDLKNYEIKSKLPNDIKIFYDLKAKNKEKEKEMVDIYNKKIKNYQKKSRVLFEIQK